MSALDALDAQLVYQWSYAREHADFRMPVNELKGVDADMIFFAGLEPWAGDFLRMARGVGIKTEIVGAFSDTPVMRARAGAALEGAMYFDFYNVNSPSPENQAFVRKFRARYGRNPDTWAAQGYDALRILAKAVQATGSAQPLDLSYAIRFMDPWEGANGRYKFDGTGELEDKPHFPQRFSKRQDGGGSGEASAPRSGDPLRRVGVPARGLPIGPAHAGGSVLNPRRHCRVPRSPYRSMSTLWPPRDAAKLRRRFQPGPAPITARS